MLRYSRLLPIADTVSANQINMEKKSLHLALVQTKIYRTERLFNGLNPEKLRESAGLLPNIDEIELYEEVVQIVLDWLTDLEKSNVEEIPYPLVTFDVEGKEVIIRQYQSSSFIKIFKHELDDKGIPYRENLFPLNKSTKRNT